MLNLEDSETFVTADGRRAMVIDGAGKVTQRYVYGAMGEVLFDQRLDPTTGDQTDLLMPVADHAGSTVGGRAQATKLPAGTAPAWDVSPRRPDRRRRESHLIDVIVAELHCGRVKSLEAIAGVKIPTAEEQENVSTKMRRCQS